MAWRPRCPFGMTPGKRNCGRGGLSRGIDSNSQADIVALLSRTSRQAGISVARNYRRSRAARQSLFGLLQPDVLCHGPGGPRGETLVPK
jgi:hypothetical protein